MSCASPASRRCAIASLAASTAAPPIASIGCDACANSARRAADPSGHLRMSPARRRAEAGRERSRAMTQSSTSERPLLAAGASLTTRSGLTLHVRPVNPEDGDRLSAFLESLAPDDLRFRFLSPVPHPSKSLVETLLSVDHVR